MIIYSFIPVRARGVRARGQDNQDNPAPGSERAQQWKLGSAGGLNPRHYGQEPRALTFKPFEWMESEPNGK